ncbi:odorant receptor 33a-like [Periplaneta americana]|uniref:odorant receptor 33a-like n=1 Tax=Periplaneta americana TaxID=6978 RepID=UPI0037E9A812
MDNGKDSTEIITEKRFNDLILASRIGGFPLNIKNSSILRSIYNVIISLCFYSVYVAELLEAYNSSELRQAMKIVRVIALHTYILIIQLNLRFRKDAFYSLLRLTEMFHWEDLSKLDSETGRLTIAGWIPRIQKILRRITMVYLASHITQRAIVAITEHELMFIGWYPIDTSTSPQFEIIYLTQIFTTVLLASVFHTFLYMYCIPVCIACSQLDSVKENLMHIQQKYDSSSEENESNCKTEREMQKKLNQCVQQHQKTLRFLQAIEATLNLPLCGMLLVLQLSLCIAAFSVITSWGDVVDILQGVLFYVLTMMLVCTYCVLGSLLTEKYESVREAAWASDWVGAPVSYQRCILLIIAKSNKEFTLTAGKFVSLSNSTMMNMLNQSLSLFMFLLTMKEKNEANLH